MGSTKLRFRRNIYIFYSSVNQSKIKISAKLFYLLKSAAYLGMTSGVLTRKTVIYQRFSTIFSRSPRTFGTFLCIFDYTCDVYQKNYFIFQLKSARCTPLYFQICCCMPKVYANIIKQVLVQKANTASFSLQPLKKSCFIYRLNNQITGNMQQSR